MRNPPCDHVTATRLAVRPTDMDADRNVNNGVYFDYFHVARFEHLARVRAFQPSRVRTGNLFALAENTCRYLAPAFYPDALLIWTATHAVGRSSFQLVYQVWREDDDALIAAGNSVQVWLDEANRSTPIPAPVQAALSTSLCPHLPKLPER